MCHTVNDNRRLLRTEGCDAVQRLTSNMVSAVGIAVCIESRAFTASSRASSAALTFFSAARISSLEGARREGPVSSVSKKRRVQGHTHKAHLLDVTTGEASRHEPNTSCKQRTV